MQFVTIVYILSIVSILKTVLLYSIDATKVEELFIKDKDLLLQSLLNQSLLYCIHPATVILQQFVTIVYIVSIVSIIKTVLLYSIDATKVEELLIKVNKVIPVNSSYSHSTVQQLLITIQLIYCCINVHIEHFLTYIHQYTQVKLDLLFVN